MTVAGPVLTQFVERLGGRDQWDLQRAAALPSHVAWGRHESGSAVVAFVFRTGHYVSSSPGDDVICTAIGYMRTLTLKLAAPLGERVVLDAQFGTPVPVTPS